VAVLEEALAVLRADLLDGTQDRVLQVVLVDEVVEVAQDHLHLREDAFNRTKLGAVSWTSHVTVASRGKCLKSILNKIAGQT